MRIIEREDYNYSVRINHRDIKCYDKKMLKDLYPNGNYIIAGETFEKNKKKEIDKVTIGKKELVVSEFGKNNKILYKRSGYLLVAKDKYLVILKSRLIFFILLFGLLCLGVGICAIGYHAFNTSNIVAPDYPLPKEDDSSTNIENDRPVDTDKVTNKNHASLKVSREVTINLKTKEVTINYQNFSASNKDAVVTLCILKDDNEYAIARSGLIKSGKEIKSMKLFDDIIKVSKGIYNGRIKIDFYDEITGEKSATSTDFDDVEIKIK